jgi:hypothetical protein
MSSSPDLSAACQVLRQFSCVTASPPPELQQALQQALQQVAQASDHQILGICADTLVQGQQALAAYATALGYTPQTPSLRSEEIQQAGAVYIKFNPISGLCYASHYEGSYRGVLVSCQSADEADLNEMFGHLPLDLFDELA